MTAKKYHTHEEPDWISNRFNKEYSKEFVQSKDNVFVYDFQGVTAILVNRKCQTFPGYTYKGEITLIGGEESKIEEIAKDIELKKFGLKKD